MHLYSASIQYPAQLRLCEQDKLNSDVFESGVLSSMREHAINTMLYNIITHIQCTK